jgi:hypothetical protein
MHWVDRVPLLAAFAVALLLGLAPFSPEPHLLEKLRLLADGRLSRPVDVFDLLWHGAPLVFLLVKLGRLGSLRLQRLPAPRYPPE